MLIIKKMSGSCRGTKRNQKKATIAPHSWSRGLNHCCRAFWMLFAHTHSGAHMHMHTSSRKEFVPLDCARGSLPLVTLHRRHLGVSLSPCRRVTRRPFAGVYRDSLKCLSHRMPTACPWPSCCYTPNFSLEEVIPATESWRVKARGCVYSPADKCILTSRKHVLPDWPGGSTACLSAVGRVIVGAW